MFSTETRVQKEFNKYLKDPVKSRLILPQRLTVIEVEKRLYSAVKILTQGTEFSLPEAIKSQGLIGRIDVVFRHKSENYVCEIKDCSKETSNFWYATKALAYTEYLKWQTGDNDYKPAVLIPQESLKLENQLVASRLKLKIYVYKIQNDGFIKVKEVKDEPHWKQNFDI